MPSRFPALWLLTRLVVVGGAVQPAGVEDAANFVLLQTHLTFRPPSALAAHDAGKHGGQEGGVIDSRGSGVAVGATARTGNASSLAGAAQHAVASAQISAATTTAQDLSPVNVSFEGHAPSFQERVSNAKFQEIISDTRFTICVCVLLFVGFIYCSGAATPFVDLVFFILPYASYIPWQGKLLILSFVAIGVGAFVVMLTFRPTQIILEVMAVPCFFLLLCAGCLSIVIQAMLAAGASTAVAAAKESYDRLIVLGDKLDDLLDFLGLGNCSSDDDVTCCAYASALARGKKTGAKAKKKPLRSTKSGRESLAPVG